MIGTGPNSNGRTGTQKLLSGIGAALAVLVLTSMLAAPAAACGDTCDIWSDPATTDLADGEDVVQERHFESVDGEDTLESGEFVLVTLDLVDGADVFESGQFGFDVLHTDSGDDDTADS